jgi:hypothetical protein
VLLGGKDVVGGKAEVVPLVGRPVVGASVVVSVGASVEVPLVGRAVVGASVVVSVGASVEVPLVGIAVVGASVEVPLVGIAVVGASVEVSVGAAVLVPLSDSGASEDVIVTEPEEVEMEEEEVTSVEEADVLLENWAKVVEAKPADNRTVDNFILIERTYFILLVFVVTTINQ